jgi:DNA-directed RNA polymerase specialized sigma24 family protein
MSQSLWDRLEYRLPTVVDRTLQSYADASSRYQGTVPEHLYRHMAHTCREFGRLYIRMFRDRFEPREPSDAELRLFRDRGRERGAEGLPVADFVESYFYLAETLWQELSRLADGNPPPEASSVLLRCLRRVMHAAVYAHQQEFQAAHSEEREAARATVRALVAGDPVGDLAHRFDIRVATSYAVIALRFGAHPTESVGDAVGRRLAGRRKVYLLNEEVIKTFSEHVLTELDPDGGLILVPSTPDGTERELAAVRAAIPRLRQVADIDVTAGFAHAAEIGAIPAVAEQAHRLVGLARAAGEVAVLDDLLFEYHQHHDSDAVPRLRAIIDTLRVEPDLMTTLTAYFANGFNRKETARQLYVHPNTVDNRLSRISALTGINPRTAGGLMVLGAALSVSDGTTQPRPGAVRSLS